MRINFTLVFDLVTFQQQTRGALAAFSYFPFVLFPTVSNVQRLSTRKFVSFHRQIQNGGLLARSKPAKGISSTNGKWTTGASKTFKRTIRILPKKNRRIWWRIRGNGKETRAVQMHLRRTGSYNFSCWLFRYGKKDKVSFIFASHRSTKRNGNCGKGRKKSPNYKKLWATCKFTSFKKENTFWGCTRKMTDWKYANLKIVKRYNICWALLRQQNQKSLTSTISHQRRLLSLSTDPGTKIVGAERCQQERGPWLDVVLEVTSEVI